MDLSELEIFRAVAAHESIVGAAAAIHRVPSNVTTRLKQLEADLGVELFIRENKRLRLSAAGHGFLVYARRILDLVDEARASVSGAEPQGWFPLGALESTAAVRIPELLAAYNQRYPKVDLDLSTGPSGAMLDRVVSGHLVAAFVDGPIHHPALEGMPVFDEEMVVVTPSQHGAIQRGRDLDGQALYAFRENCSYRRHLERWMADDGATPGKIRELESYHSMLACVSAGSGAAIMPRSMLEHMPGSASVAAWPLPDDRKVLTTWLVWRSDTATAALDAFKAMINDSGLM